MNAYTRNILLSVVALIVLCGLCLFLTATIYNLMVESEDAVLLWAVMA